VSGDGHCTIKVGNSEGSSEVFGVKAMQKREVAVTMHRIASIITLPDGSDVVIHPEFTFSDADLKAVLDRIFGWQVNAWFNVTINSPIPLRWDVAASADYGINDPDAVTEYNEVLDLGGTYADTLIPPGERVSLEQKRISEPSYGGVVDPAADINVYLVGGAEFLHERYAKFNGDDDPSGSKDAAVTNRTVKRVWVAGNLFDHPSGHGNGNDGIMHTIAHEVGHVLIGGGHPDQGGGAAPLPETAHSLRLMCSGFGKNRQNPGKLLVKMEWDEADDWLGTNIDDPNN